MRHLHACLIIGLCLPSISCETFEDTTLDPFRGQGRYYTVYGFLDVAETEHVLRVIPIRRTPEEITAPSEANAFIDAVVWSTDLDTGRRVGWRHDLSQLSDGTLAHIYSASMRIEADHAYRIEVIRSDGAQSSAVTVVPSLSTSIGPVVDPAVVFQSEAFQKVHLTGVPRAFDITVLYEVSDGGVSLPHGARVEREYGAAGAVDADGRWSFEIDLSRDAAAILETVMTDPGVVLELEEMGVRARWVDEQWPAFADRTDLNLLGQPGGVSNVENGDGFVGSIGTYTRFWRVEDAELKAVLGFR
ncbi:MAG: hypothetical protein KJO98_09815 [Rhodothermia bacterium]|nr:hypothetical protein [Rhodothermia bacterium]